MSLGKDFDFSSTGPADVREQPLQSHQPLRNIHLEEPPRHEDQFSPSLSAQTSMILAKIELTRIPDNHHSS